MNTKTKTEQQGSLYRFLAWNYGLLTAVTLLFLLIIYAGWNRYMDRRAPFPDPADLFLQAEQMEDQEFCQLDVESAAGPGSSLSLLDGKGRVLFSSLDEEKDRYLPGELKCIPGYFSSSQLLAASLPEGSVGSYLVTRAQYAETGETQIDGYLVLDEDYSILEGSLEWLGKGFTPEEFQYLTGRDRFGRNVYRHSYVNAGGQPRQLILRFWEPGNQGYQQLYEVRELVWWILIPAYVATALAGLFIFTRRFKRLLEPLNQGILNVSRGEKSGLKSYEGPRELAAVASNFVSMEEQLEESRQKQKEMDQERRRLLADISHDLRTPATVIQGYAMALKDHMVPENQRETYLNVIAQKADQLGSLLSAFHEYSKLDHPRLRLNQTRQDLCQMVREYFAARYYELELKGFELEAEIPEEKIFLMLDGQLIVRCLDNLVNNFMSANSPGTRLSIQIERKQGQVWMILADNGKGISKEMRKKIFQPFVTGDPTRPSGKGSGLGLAIVKQIVELHQGKVWLAEEPSRDWKTEFVITFPEEKG